MRRRVRDNALQLENETGSLEKANPILHAFVNLSKQAEGENLS